VDEAGLRRFLTGLLPPHMVPTRLTVTAALPFTASGKIDRPALAAVQEGN